MKLQTNVEIAAPKRRIDFSSKLLMIGSCFTENIGRILEDYKFPVFLNPCGIAYNPVSVCNSISFLTGSKKLKTADLVFNNDLWHSLHHHGSFSDRKKEEVENKITLKIAQGKHCLKNATHIFLTLGTAWVFEHIATRQIINNCHKIPAKEFQRKRLSVQEITDILEQSISEIQQLNPTAEIIFTVSPVRHKKDGFHENQLSKATLLLAIAELQKKDSGIGYFPAYEIVLDELRDYRFFAEDFCHLNELGSTYVWEKFAANYIEKEAQLHFPAIKKLQKALNHRIQERDSTATQNFQQKLLMQIQELEKQLPTVDFSKEAENILKS